MLFRTWEPLLHGVFTQARGCRLLSVMIAQRSCSFVSWVFQIRLAADEPTPANTKVPWNCLKAASCFLANVIPPSLRQSSQWPSLCYSLARSSDWMRNTTPLPHWQFVYSIRGGIFKKCMKKCMLWKKPTNTEILKSFSTQTNLCFSSIFSELFQVPL